MIGPDRPTQPSVASPLPSTRSDERRRRRTDCQKLHPTAAAAGQARRSKVGVDSSSRPAAHKETLPPPAPICSPCSLSPPPRPFPFPFPSPPPPPNTTDPTGSAKKRLGCLHRSQVGSRKGAAAASCPTSSSGRAVESAQPIQAWGADSNPLPLERGDKRSPSPPQMTTLATIINQSIIITVYTVFREG